MSEITKAEMRKKLGNISQLQDLLFGEQIEIYNQEIDKQKQRVSYLELKQDEFQSTIEAQIKKLENQLIVKIDAVNNTLEKRLTYLELTTQEEQAKIQQELDAVSQHSHHNIGLLQDNFKNKTNYLKTEIAQSKSDLEGDLQLVKQQVMEKLDTSLAQLSTGKVSRDDLAEVLFEICLKLKEPNTSLELSQGQEDSAIVEQPLEPDLSFNRKITSDLMLPEQQLIPDN